VNYNTLKFNKLVKKLQYVQDRPENHNQNTAAKSHGDGKKIADANDGITDMDVSRAFSKGECSDNVFECIGKYFKEKESMVKEYL